MNRLSVFRISVFWIWAITLVVVIAVFVYAMVFDSMRLVEIEGSLTNVTGLLLPQLSVMTAFFFGTSKRSQASLLTSDRGTAVFAVATSLLYHIIFWIVLFLAIARGMLGDTIDENTSALMKIMGIVSVFGLAPVAYLFAHTDAARALSEGSATKKKTTNIKQSPSA